MNIVEFDFQRVNELKDKTSDELIDGLLEEKIQRGNEKLIEMGAIRTDE